MTDPPYGLGFMGKSSMPCRLGLEVAEECLRVLKPGGHLLAFGGTCTWHRLAVAVEDAGFRCATRSRGSQEVGFRNLNVSRDLDGKRCACAVNQGMGAAKGSKAWNDAGLMIPCEQCRNISETITEPGEATGSGVLRLQLPIEGERGGADSSQVRRDRDEAKAPLWAGQPGLEGRSDLRAAEGQLSRSAVRAVPTGSG